MTEGVNDIVNKDLVRGDENRRLFGHEAVPRLTRATDNWRALIWAPRQLTKKPTWSFFSFSLHPLGTSPVRTETGWIQFPHPTFGIFWLQTRNYIYSAALSTSSFPSYSWLLQMEPIWSRVIKCLQHAFLMEVRMSVRVVIARMLLGTYSRIHRVETGQCWAITMVRSTRRVVIGLLSPLENLMSI